jgi:hypothetical protein
MNDPALIFKPEVCGNPNILQELPKLNPKLPPVFLPNIPKVLVIQILGTLHKKAVKAVEHSLETRSWNMF